MLMPMKTKWVAWLAMALLVSSCRRNDPRTTTVHVPDMADDKDVKIVRQALEYELARNDQSFYVSVKTGTLQFFSSSQVAVPEAQRAVEAELTALGLPPKQIQAKPQPSDNWPDRHVLQLIIPEMKNHRAANIAVGTISRVMVNRDNPNVVIDRETRTATVKFDSMLVAVKNFEHVVVNVGFKANQIPVPDLPHTIPNGWCLLVD